MSAIDLGPMKGREYHQLLNTKNGINSTRRICIDVN